MKFLKLCECIHHHLPFVALVYREAKAFNRCCVSQEALRPTDQGLNPGPAIISCELQIKQLHSYYLNFPICRK